MDKLIEYSVYLLSAKWPAKCFTHTGLCYIDADELSKSCSHTSESNGLFNMFGTIFFFYPSLCHSIMAIWNAILTARFLSSFFPYNVRCLLVYGELIREATRADRERDMSNRERLFKFQIMHGVAAIELRSRSCAYLWLVLAAHFFFLPGIRDQFNRSNKKSNCFLFLVLLENGQHKNTHKHTHTWHDKVSFEFLSRVPRDQHHRWGRRPPAHTQTHTHTYVCTQLR